jgi:hypothetical protein
MYDFLQPPPAPSQSLQLPSQERESVARTGVWNATVNDDDGGGDGAGSHGGIYLCPHLYLYDYEGTKTDVCCGHDVNPPSGSLSHTLEEWNFVWEDLMIIHAKSNAIHVNRRETEIVPETVHRYGDDGCENGSEHEREENERKGIGNAGGIGLGEIWRGRFLFQHG